MPTNETHVYLPKGSSEAEVTIGPTTDEEFVERAIARAKRDGKPVGDDGLRAQVRRSAGYRERAMSSPDREALGRLVREVWVEHAKKQPDPKPHHLLPWDDLDEPSKEVDRRIGEVLHGLGWADALARVAVEVGESADGETILQRCARLRGLEDEVRWATGAQNAGGLRLAFERLEADLKETRKELSRALVDRGEWARRWEALSDSQAAAHALLEGHAQPGPLARRVKDVVAAKDAARHRVGWMCDALDSTGRRGIWVRQQALDRLEICAGREGDDAYVDLRVGQRVTPQLLAALRDLLPRGRDPGIDYDDESTTNVKGDRP